MGRRCVPVVVDQPASPDTGLEAEPSLAPGLEMLREAHGRHKRLSRHARSHCCHPRYFLCLNIPNGDVWD